MLRARDFTGREIEFSCMSCDISAHKLVPPGGMIYEDNFVTLAGDVEVPIEGFIILAPKRHVVSLDELSPLEMHHLVEVLGFAVKALKELGICKKVEIYQEEKHHLHIWILPRHDWMDKNQLGIKTDSKKLFQFAKERAKENGVFDVMYAIQRLKTYFEKY